MLRKATLIACMCCVLAQGGWSQNDSLRLVNYKRRQIILGSAGAALTIGSLVYLNQAWYSSYNTGKFHFFNDDGEWLQMDKAGHFFTTYQTGRLVMNAFDWAGASGKQQLFIGGSVGLAYMTAIEMMDGFSSGWGFSWGDEVADVLGTSVAIAQQAFWHGQRIQFKFSYSPSGMAKYNPSLLGDSFYTQILKDYNAQTLWMSINPSAFMRRETRFPKWLNVALGYGADGMIGAFSNNIVVKDASGHVLNFNRERQFYLSLDVDLTRIKTKSKVLKSIFSVINILKFPAPALMLSHNKFRFYYLYY